MRFCCMVKSELFINQVLNRKKGSSSLVAHSYASIRKHLLQHMSPIDIYIHSWNPELKTSFRLYSPIWQKHEKFVYNDKVLSQSFSLYKTIRKKQQIEYKFNFTYDMIFVLRHDIVFRSDLLPQHLPASPFILAQHCCKEGDMMKPCTVSRFIGHVNISRDLDQKMYIMDWFISGKSRILDTLTMLYLKNSIYHENLQKLGIGVRWMHFFLAYHVHFVLNMTDSVRFVMLGGHDYGIARVPPNQYIYERKLKIGHAFSSKMCPQSGSSVKMCPHIPEPYHKFVKSGFVGHHYIPELNAFYYEIPKSGSSSIVNMFRLRHGEHDVNSHLSAFHFTVIRHPICRFISGLNTAYSRAWWRTNDTNSPCPFWKYPYLTKEPIDIVMQKAIDNLNNSGSMYVSSSCGYAHHHLMSQSYFIQNFGTPAYPTNMKHGYCERTGAGSTGDGECDIGNKGTWNLDHTDWNSSINYCANLCQKCARCNHISLSIEFNDCSWYHTCTTTHVDIGSFVTLHNVKKEYHL